MKRIVVVEPNSATANEIRLALEKEYTVILFDNEVSALEYLKEKDAELILQAMELYIRDGLQLLKEIKKIPRMEKIPTLVLLEANQAEMQQKVLQMGAEDFIMKPFVQEVIMKRVKTQLDLYEYRTNTAVVEKFQDAISVSLAELVECRDITTGGHIKNTTQYFKIFLEEIIKQEKYQHCIPEKDMRVLLRAVPLHDIGKIGINDEILRKASSLDYNEFEYMKTHTILGKETFDKIIKETGGTRLLYIARDMAYCHHERWDGTGYPNGLKGDEIPLYARILTIVDVYDALTSRRTYKEPFSHQTALDIIMEGQGSLFDPHLVDIFYKVNKRIEEALLGKKRER